CRVSSVSLHFFCRVWGVLLHFFCPIGGWDFWVFVGGVIFFGALGGEKLGGSGGKSLTLHNN
ncbi:MAG: hypothetical protein Q4B68_01945, partial [Bacteroidales bacterium]|nr:hypothetical protein [Bacteroidales bacterium]